MRNYDNIDLSRGSDSEDFKKTEMVENLKKYVGNGEQKRQRIAELAAKSGLSEQTVEITCCTFAGLDVNVLKLHNILMDILNEYKQNIETQTKQDPEGNNFDDMLQQLKQFSKYNTVELYTLAEITGLSPQKVVEIINSQESTPEDITILYNAMNNLLSEKTTNFSSNIQATSYEEPKSKAM